MRYALVIALALAVAPVQAHSLKELEDSLSRREAYVEFVQRPAPLFSLVDSKGNRVGLSDFKGKVVVLNFLYAHCPDVCPLHSALIAGLQTAINLTVMSDIVQFISITTDPERDTPDVMDAYGIAQGLDTTNWQFLTAADEDNKETRALAEAYGLKFTPGDDGYLLHGIVTYLIDKSGNLRARYHGLKVDPLNIILMINALSNDSH